MIQEELRPILEQIRLKALKDGINNLSLERMNSYHDIPLDVLKKYVSSNEELVEKTLELEREKFMVIFIEFDFEGMNAIDIMMIVSKEVSKKFTEVSPSITHQLNKLFPEIYHAHFEKRIQFISDKIRINLTKGISQGMYRSDLSIELIARLYISRLIDIHNPDFFPPEEFSFKTLFDQMFESFVRSVATPEGLEYFEKQKKSFRF
jgi:TetR/AcrR family transcriptional regulator, cholesterol catabolism regulator